MSRRIISAAAGALVCLAALAGCAAPAEQPQPSAAASAAPTPDSSVEPATTPAPTEPAAKLSCETMISPGTVDALSRAGWTSEPKEFVVGDVELTEGLLCLWADHSVGSDHAQLYGWSPVTVDEEARAQESLVDGGWRREDAPEGIYFTEDPQYSMSTDEDGYGMTYLFGDGWVKLADTKQGLVLIEWAA